MNLSRKTPWKWKKVSRLLICSIHRQEVTIASGFWKTSYCRVQPSIYTQPSEYVILLECNHSLIIGKNFIFISTYNIWKVERKFYYSKYKRGLWCKINAISTIFFPLDAKFKSLMVHCVQAHSIGAGYLKKKSRKKRSQQFGLPNDIFEKKQWNLH